MVKVKTGYLIAVVAGIKMNNRARRAMRVQVPRILLKKGVQASLEARFSARLEKMDAGQITIGFETTGQETCALCADYSLTVADKARPIAIEIMDHLKGLSGTSEWKLNEIRGKMLDTVLLPTPRLSELPVAREPSHGGIRHATPARGDKPIQ